MPIYLSCIRFTRNQMDFSGSYENIPHVTFYINYEGSHSMVPTTFVGKISVDFQRFLFNVSKSHTNLIVCHKAL